MGASDKRCVQRWREQTGTEGINAARLGWAGQPPRSAASGIISSFVTNYSGLLSSQALFMEPSI